MGKSYDIIRIDSVDEEKYLDDKRERFARAIVAGEGLLRAYRNAVKQEYKYAKQSGGKGQYGHVFLEVKPLASGSEENFKFNNDIKGGVIPKEYIPAVEKGCFEAMQGGILAGYPMVDIEVTVYDGSYHDVDSSEMAFKLAASMGFKQACRSPEW